MGDREWTGEISTLPSGRGKGRRWERVGCFDNGVDWFGDGSLWLIDTPGVCPFVRTIAEMVAYNRTLDAPCSSHFES